MITNLKKLVKRLIPQWPILQRTYLGLYYLGLWGMNYGVGGNLSQTGEIHALKILRKRFKKRDLTLFDVGANKGSYTTALRLVFPEAKIYCFEPFSAPFSRLIEHIQADENIFPFQIGFGDKEEKKPIHFQMDITSHSSLIQKKVKVLSRHSDIEEVNIECIDSFCEKRGIDNIDFLKIDVEGYELNVLKGAYRLLSNKRIECIQFEFGGTQIDAKVFFKDLWNLLSEDYFIYRILRNNLIPISQYTESLEIFHFSNFVAIQKGHKKYS